MLTATDRSSYDHAPLHTKKEFFVGVIRTSLQKRKFFHFRAFLRHRLKSQKYNDLLLKNVELVRTVGIGS